MVPLELLGSLFPVKGILLAAWLTVGLIVAGIAAAVGGRRAFAWSLGVTWVAVPLIAGLYVFVSSKRVENENREIIQKLEAEYRKLCDAPDREVIRRTVKDVEEVALSPSRGPEDRWGNDLFYPSRGGGPPVSDRWLTGSKNGRYGDFRKVVLLSAPSDRADTPRYYIQFKHLTAGFIGERAAIHGVEIKILDTVAREVIAERRDYMATLRDEFVAPKGCTGRTREQRRKWHQDHVAFIRKVLIPRPGVQIVQKNMPIPHDRERRFPIRPEDFPAAVAARVMWERPPTSRIESVEKHLPPGVEYGYSAAEDRRGKYSDRALVLLKADRDIKIGQGIDDYHARLLAAALDKDSLVAIIAAGLNSEDIRPFLVLRRFGPDGDLVYQTRVDLPDPIATAKYILSPDYRIELDKTEYRLWLSLRGKDGYGTDVRISIPRAVRSG